MADVAPKQPPTQDDKIAQHLRMIGSEYIEEGRTAFRFAVREMKSAGRNWSDVGNAYQHYFKHGGPNGDAGKFSEAEMQAYSQDARERGVEAGIKIGKAQAQANGNGNGHGHGYTLPRETAMADFCYAQLYRLESKHHEFAKRMYARRGNRISRKELGYLMSIYVQAGGKI